MFFPEVEGQFGGVRSAKFIKPDALELRPLGWELMPHGEQTHRPNRLSFVDAGFEVAYRAGSEQAAAFAGCVAEVEDDIGDGVVVELAHVGGQVQLPLADGA